MLEQIADSASLAQKQAMIDTPPGGPVDLVCSAAFSRHCRYTLIECGLIPALQVVWRPNQQTISLSQDRDRALPVREHRRR